MLEFYARFCFTQNLIPLLRSSGRARVISVRAGGTESEWFFKPDDLLLEAPGTFGGMATMVHMVNMATLALERLAEMPENRNIVFIHAHPGIVRTGNLFRGCKQCPCTNCMRDLY